LEIGSDAVFENQSDTNLRWRNQASEYSSDPDDDALKSKKSADRGETPEKIDNILSAYLCEAVQHPLLTAEEEIELGTEIRACQERLVDLLLKLPLTIKEIDELKVRIRMGKKNGNKTLRPKEDLIDGILWRLKKIEREFPKDENLQTLADQIHQAEAKLRNISAIMARCNLRLVLSISKNFRNRGLPLLDLIQEGNIGLLKAVARFDASKGNRFCTYATWWIQQAIRRGIEEKGRTIRLPGSMLETMNRYRWAIGSSAKASGGHLVENVMENPRRPFSHLEPFPDHMDEPISLETPVGDGRERLIDLIPDEDPQTPTETIIQKELSEELRKTIRSALSPREERIIKQRFGLEENRQHTLGEVAMELGISRERVRQIQNKALKKLERAGEENGLKELRP
jgi:RNA polymerase primary sigma factor